MKRCNHDSGQPIRPAREYVRRQRQLDGLAAILVITVAVAVFWLLPAASSPAEPAVQSGSFAAGA